MIRIGTASWTDPSLVKSGKFYPKGCSSPEARLRFYASRFPMVEVDSSYYAMPSASNAAKWAERTPPDFIFNLKAFRVFTGHQTPKQALPKDIGEALAGHFATHRNVYYRDLPVELRDELWRRFDLALMPLREAGKLRAVHFQFAPWVHASRKALAHIEECQARLPHDLLAVEFRHRSWFDGEQAAQTLAFERERGLVNVTVDEPQGFANSIPTVWDVTQPRLALLRMHGRNAATWNIGGEAASDRFNYDYSDDELGEVAAAVQGLATQALEVHVVFNNNYEDQGQRNAATLQRLTGGVPEGAGLRQVE